MYNLSISRKGKKLAQLADYAITAVHYNNDPRHIDSVKARKLDANNNMGAEQEYLRMDIVNAIVVNNVTFITVFYQNNQYQIGAMVEAVPIPRNGQTYYLQTVKDGTPKDNLDELPRF